MKKVMLCLFLAAGINFSAFANEPVTRISEGWLRVGFEFGNFFEWYVYEGTVWRSYIGSLGVNFSSYRFTDGRNVGLFSSGFFGVPTINYDTNNFDNFGFRFQTGLIIGAGFRRQLSERFTFHSGIGLSFMNSIFSFTEYFPSVGNVEFEVGNYTFGIGGDIGFKFSINNSVFLSMGSIFTYDFANFSIVEAFTRRPSTRTRVFMERISGWDELFRMVGIRPYISIGFYIRQQIILR